MRSLFYFGGLLVAMAAFHSAICAQDDGFKEAKVLNSPKVAVPNEAKVTGLGGRVNVRVSVDEIGNVSAVEFVGGPGPVCTSVTRADVLAMRKLASEAAMKSKFSPAKRGGTAEKSSAWISFEFPADPSKKELTFSASNDGPKYYEVTPSTSTDVNAKSTRPPARSPKTISGGVLAGRAKLLPAPTYPPAARAVKASGTVEIQVLVDENGDIFSAEAVSGHPLLRSTSVIAACGAKFPPTLLSGQPVKVAGIITYNFVP